VPIERAAGPVSQEIRPYLRARLATSTSSFGMVSPLVKWATHVS
jgi:hypothetical protein